MRSQLIVDPFIELCGLNLLINMLKLKNTERIQCAILMICPIFLQFESAKEFIKNNSNIFMTLWEQTSSERENVKIITLKGFA